MGGGAGGGGSGRRGRVRGGGHADARRLTPPAAPPIERGARPARYLDSRIGRLFENRRGRESEREGESTREKYDVSAIKDSATKHCNTPPATEILSTCHKLRDIKPFALPAGVSCTLQHGGFVTGCAVLVSVKNQTSIPEKHERLHSENH